MPGIMSEGSNFENHQSSVQQSQHPLWHRHEVRIESNIGSVPSMRTDSVLPEACDRT